LTEGHIGERSPPGQPEWSVYKIELGRTDNNCGRAGGHLNRSRSISSTGTALMLAPEPGKKPWMGWIDG